MKNRLMQGCNRIAIMREKIRERERERESERQRERERVRG